MTTNTFVRVGLSRPLFAGIILFSIFSGSLLAAEPTSKPALPTEGTVADGYDWSLPAYASDNTQGGLTRRTWRNSDKPETYTNTAFYSMRWYEVETETEIEAGKKEPTVEAQYNFNDFNKWLKKWLNADGDGKVDEDRDHKVVVRLEVNSLCDTPYHLRDTFNYYAGGSIAFWQDAYIARLEKFINAFANEYAGDPRIKGVHLGIADGEYTDIADALKLSKSGAGQDFYKNYCTEAIKATDKYSFYVGDDGWGEFWVNEDQLKSAINLEENGLTVSGLDEDDGTSNETTGNFQDSVERIIDIYTKAFNQNLEGLASESTESQGFISKLAMTNLTNFVYNAPGSAEDVPDAVIDRLNEIKTTQIIPYALDAGVGNRDGLIEDWMSYSNPIYGIGFDQSGPDNTCKMTMDEDHAEAFGDSRYWGTENEEYGNADWVVSRHGPYETQPYRFMLSSLRALQMRRNHMLINTNAMYDMTEEGDAKLDSEYNTKDFLKYLASTIGRKKTDTPDAFVVLGERYIRPNYIKGYDSDDSSFSALANCAVTSVEEKASGDEEKASEDEEKVSYVQISEYGRWLTEVSGKGTKSNLIKLTSGVEPWSIPSNLPEIDGETKYDYAARDSSELRFDINDTVITERCNESVCALEVKVVFEDTVATTLSLITGAGIVGSLETSGLGGTKTATFALTDTFANGFEGADFGLKTSTDAETLPVFMARVNFVNQ